MVRAEEKYFIKGHWKIAFTGFYKTISCLIFQFRKHKVLKANWVQ